MKCSKYFALLSMMSLAILFSWGCGVREPVTVENDLFEATKQVSLDGNQETQKLSVEDEFTIPLHDDRAEPLIVYHTTELLNLREGPSGENPIITTIPKGEELTYLSADGEWLEVSYGGDKGYVHKNYLQESHRQQLVGNISVTMTEERDVVILMYHAIDEYNGKGGQELYVTPANFESQMQYLKSEGFTPISFADLVNLEGIEKPVLITFDDGYKNNMNAYLILQKLDDEDFQAKATIFMIGSKIDKKTGLSTEQLKEMAASGIISIQSHTETHPSLTEITDFEQELNEIKFKLEGITGEKVIAIAYPAGKYDNRVIEETQKYYEFAVTTHQGIANTSESPYEMKRIRINYSTDLSGFKYLVNH
ncbi:polysaccharide deacetylase family protein [Cytobacillus purgationiresistens]|uniref:Peptidoglycan/xylan/chitin deacetylase (PgdA/CDA1 family) n=1 Tax=Cytobacillus purgationiresistens TaxID=863449 RepID=A0ABU0AKU1_9BACI|nr:polysaccharide deacetylase family protein [Cytobacillus purgationiresistens]MDQ0271874.1 peptidoglycan/xylan/chitin deacetylase (PgdA/CDA1 family) [Cytobacillus purgationiresistens]